MPLTIEEQILEQLKTKDKGKTQEEIEAGFKQISDQAKEKDDLVDQIGSKYRKQVEEKKLGGGIDNMRYASKEMLKGLYSEYKEKTTNLEILDFLEDIETYAEMDITASKTDQFQQDSTNPDIKSARTDYLKKIRDSLNDERDLFNKICNRSAELFKKWEEELGKVNPDDKEEYQRIQDNVRIISSMLSFFEGQRNGNLEYAPDDAKKIDATGMKFRMLQANETFDNMKNDKTVNKSIPVGKDVPLFSHDPSPYDLTQGGMGDCFLLSGLSELAQKYPEKIKDMIRENEKDGTVTVRFFSKKFDPELGPGVNDTYEPVYVTIKKEVMSDGMMEGAKFNLWAQMIERAYAASGLEMAGRSVGEKTGTLNSGMAQYTQPVPNDIKDIYQKLLKTPHSKWPSHSECPWLIDLNGNLHEYQADMRNIEGGLSEIFLEHVLGEDFAGKSIDTPEQILDGFDVLAEMAVQIWEDNEKINGRTPTKEQLDTLRNKLTDAVKKDSKVGLDLIGQTIVKGITGNDPILDENGLMEMDYEKIKAKNGDITQLLVDQMLTDIGVTAGRTLSADLKAGRGFDLNKICDKVKGLYSDPDNNQLEGRDNKFFVTRRKSIYTNRNSFFQIMTDALADGGQKLKDRVCGGNRFMGNYTDKQNKMFEDMDKACKSGGLVTAGTRKELDESTGMVKKHAYSVVRCTTENVNGVDVKFVEVRNPYGYKGIKYERNRMVPDMTPEGGVFKVELTDFCNMYEKYTINQKGIKSENKFGEATLDAQTTQKYANTIQSLYGELVDTDDNGKKAKTSDEYSKFRDALRDFNRVLQGGTGARIDDLATTDEYRKLVEAREAYKVHCEKNPKSLSSRRNTRMKVADAVDNIIKGIMQNKKDPKEAAFDKIADKVVGKLGEMMRNSKDEAERKRGEAIATKDEIKKKAIDKFKKSEVFVKAFKGRLYSDICKVAEKEPKDLVKGFMKAMITPTELDMEISKAQTVQQPEITNPETEMKNEKGGAVMQ